MFHISIPRTVLRRNKVKKNINFRQIWDNQKVSDTFENDVAKIAKVVFDAIYDENRTTANIETYCKREECWTIISKKEYALSDALIDILCSPHEIEIETSRAKKEQKFDSGILNEVEIFKKGSQYWETLIQKGVEQDVLLPGETAILRAVINYCKGIYAQLTRYQLKEVKRILEKLKENMIV